MLNLRIKLDLRKTFQIEWCVNEYFHKMNRVVQVYLSTKLSVNLSLNISLNIGKIIGFFVFLDNMVDNDHDGCNISMDDILLDHQNFKLWNFTTFYVQDIINFFDVKKMK